MQTMNEKMKEDALALFGTIAGCDGVKKETRERAAAIVRADTLDDEDVIMKLFRMSRDWRR
jgi:hypothetical protein